jgi:hypothetical protein
MPQAFIFCAASLSDRALLDLFRSSRALKAIARPSRKFLHPLRRRCAGRNLQLRIVLIMMLLHALRARVWQHLRSNLTRLKVLAAWMSFPDGRSRPQRF